QSATNTGLPFWCRPTWEGRVDSDGTKVPRHKKGMTKIGERQGRGLDRLGNIVIPHSSNMAHRYPIGQVLAIAPALWDKLRSLNTKERLGVLIKYFFFLFGCQKVQAIDGMNDFVEVPIVRTEHQPIFKTRFNQGFHVGTKVWLFEYIRVGEGRYVGIHLGVIP